MQLLVADDRVPWRPCVFAAAKKCVDMTRRVLAMANGDLILVQPAAVEPAPTPAEGCRSG